MDGFILSGSDLFAGKAKLPIKKDKRIVLVGGCFDVIHHGHLSFLKKAKKEGDILVVALENDTFILKRKKRRVFHSQIQRAEMLAHLRSVGGVICLPDMKKDDDYIELVQSVRPSVIAVTEGDAYLPRKRAYARLVSARVKVVCKLIDGLSSSTITTYARILRD